MFAREGTVKLVDFDLSRRLDDSMHLTRTGMAMGTPHYMSPEQADALPVNKTSDIFSLGVICYEMLCGVKPFPGNSDTEVRQSRSRDPNPMEVVNPLVPPRVSAVVRRMLVREPDQRLQSVTDARRELDAAIHDLGLFDEHIALAEYAAEPDRVRNEMIQKRLATHLTRAQAAEVKGPEGQAEAMREYACALHLDPQHDQARKALMRLQAYAEARAALEQKRAKESAEARGKEEAEAVARAEREERQKAELAAKEKRALEDRERAAAEAREQMAADAKARAERETKQREALERQRREEDERRRLEEERRAGQAAQDPLQTMVYPATSGPPAPPPQTPTPQPEPRIEAPPPAPAMSARAEAPAPQAPPPTPQVAPSPPQTSSPPPAAPRPAAPPPSRAPMKASRSLIALIAGAAAALVLVVAALVFHPWERPKAPEPAPAPMPAPPAPAAPDTTAPTPTPAALPTFARLQVMTTPSGARITLDRKVRKVSPALFDSLDAGPHRVFIRNAGYADTLREFTLAAGFDTTVAVVLRPAVVEKRVTLAVTTSPADAEVRLDGGAPQPGSAARFTGLRRGTHVVDATRTGHRPARVSVTLSGLRDSSLALTLETTQVVPPPPLRKARLKVSSHPSGAKLKLDGRVEQSAPHNFTDVTEGMHTLAVSKAGYQSELRTFGFSARKDSAFTIRLQSASGGEAPAPADGYYAVSAEPWADVYLDGKLVESHVTNKTFAARPGSHRLELKHPLFPGTSDNIKIESGVTLPALSPDFMSIAGILEVEAAGGAGAEVLVKGIVMGTAPARIPIGPGTWKVTVRKAGLRPLEGEKTVKIKAGETVREVFSMVGK